MGCSSSSPSMAAPLVSATPGTPQILPKQMALAEDKGPNPNLEVLHSKKEVEDAIRTIQERSPRKTDSGAGKVPVVTADGKQFTLDYAYVSQTGWYQDTPNKANQDCVKAIEDFGSSGDVGLGGNRAHFFSVFDGHGKYGDKCSLFVRERLPANLLNDPQLKEGNWELAFVNSFVKTNNELHTQTKDPVDGMAWDDVMSGTTAVTTVVRGERLYVANVGDSRAIVATKTPSGKIVAEPLSIDQTPFRVDERKRVIRAGARVLTMDQIEGLRDPEDQNFGNEEDDDGDPPRLWAQDGPYPGTAFTRSLGDRIAEKIGVYAEPEILVRDIDAQDKFILVASDGVFEFMSSQTVVDIVEKYSDTLEACRAVVAEAYRMWLQYEVRTDDISAVLIRLEGVQATRTDALRKVKSKIGDLIAKGEVRPVRRGMTRAKMGSVGQVKFDEEELEGYTLPTFPKSAEDVQRIEEAVRANFLFRHLNEAQLKSATMAMEKLTVKAGDVIIRQFDEGDKFYIAQSGMYDVTVAVPKLMEDVQGSKIAIPGEFEEPRLVMTYDCSTGLNPSFGELALMYSKPRQAAITATADGELWTLERKAFKNSAENARAEAHAASPQSRCAQFAQAEAAEATGGSSNGGDVFRWRVHRQAGRRGKRFLHHNAGKSKVHYQDQY